jgi:hypothetical protein
MSAPFPRRDELVQELKRRTDGVRRELSGNRLSRDTRGVGS